MAIDAERLLADLDALRRIGRDRTGVHRPALGEADMAARRWVAERMRAADLAPTMDGVGNVLGRGAGTAPALLIGSHTDSVPHGGWLDGALGVAYGLEIARAVAAGAPDLAGRIDVVDFQDEEGTFHPCLGSRAAVGALAPDTLADQRDAGGRRFGDERAADDLAATPCPPLDAGRYRAFLEAHIEQGPRLEQAGLDVGVVTGIVAIRRYAVAATGRADHAGTTPMAVRRDAGQALLRLAPRLLDTVARVAGADTVWNIGRIAFTPGAANVVPAEAELTLEVRDPDTARLDAIEAALAQLMDGAQLVDGADAGDGAVSWRRTAVIEPVSMNPVVADALVAAAAARGASSLRLASGAGHDAMILAPHVPSAMLFIPSIGGRSHDVQEDSEPEDIVRGCRVMADAAVRLLAG